MKKIIILGLALMSVLGLTTQVFAVRGTPGVAWTLHNLSDDNISTYTTNEDEICIFCHTPHGGTLSGPLWNRNLPGANSFTLYSSATLTTAASNTSRPVNAESLLCLSCHDGSIAVNRVLNASNDIGQPVVTFYGGDAEVQPGFTRPGPRIGGSLAAPGGQSDLSDDHPISFSYYDAQAEENLAGGPAGLRAPGDPALNDVRFFGNGAVAGGMRLECSSCHDPHVNYDSFTPGNPGAQPQYTPFLITPNTGSALCLACHIK